jgi:hypothetical protein
MKNPWSNARLQRLFGQYNRKYFRGKLSHYRIKTGILRGACGICYTQQKRIIIDVKKHEADSDIQSTVLHEMAHAICERPGEGHDIYFFEQVESLLRKKAPITISASEYDAVIILVVVAPRRFPLLNRELDRIRT